MNRFLSALLAGTMLASPASQAASSSPLLLAQLQNDADPLHRRVAPGQGPAPQAQQPARPMPPPMRAGPLPPSVPPQQAPAQQVPVQQLPQPMPHVAPPQQMPQQPRYQPPVQQAPVAPAQPPRPRFDPPQQDALPGQTRYPRSPDYQGQPRIQQPQVLPRTEVPVRPQQPPAPRQGDGSPQPGTSRTFPPVEFPRPPSDQGARPYPAPERPETRGPRQDAPQQAPAAPSGHLPGSPAPQPGRQPEVRPVPAPPIPSTQPGAPPGRQDHGGFRGQHDPNGYPLPPRPAPQPAPGGFQQQPPPPDGGQRPERPRAGGIRPGVAIGIGAGVAAGLAGGFLASRGGHDIEDIRRHRERRDGGDGTVVREPGRTIWHRDNLYFLRHDETERFLDLGGEIRSEPRGGDTVTVFTRPDGSQVVTVTDRWGRVLRRWRHDTYGRDIVIIDNTWAPAPEAFVSVPAVPALPPEAALAEPNYVVDMDAADGREILDTLSSPPVGQLPRRFSLDEVLYSYDVRSWMRSLDVSSIEFRTGSWQVPEEQANLLAQVAWALNEVLRVDPSEVFLVEGHTDAVGSDVDNLSLSDRRAQEVAAVLTRDFGVPPENLVTQGYGSQFRRFDTLGADRRNRRVTIRRITPLLNGR